MQQKDRGVVSGGQRQLGVMPDLQSQVVEIDRRVGVCGSLDTVESTGDHPYQAGPVG